MAKRLDYNLNDLKRWVASDLANCANRASVQNVRDKWKANRRSSDQAAIEELCEARQTQLDRLCELDRQLSGCTSADKVIDVLHNWIETDGAISAEIQESCDRRLKALKARAKKKSGDPRFVTEKMFYDRLFDFAEKYGVAWDRTEFFKIVGGNSADSAPLREDSPEPSTQDSRP